MTYFPGLKVVKMTEPRGILPQSPYSTKCSICRKGMNYNTGYRVYTSMEELEGWYRYVCSEACVNMFLLQWS